MDGEKQQQPRQISTLVEQSEADSEKISDSCTSSSNLVHLPNPALSLDQNFPPCKQNPLNIRGWSMWRKLRVGLMGGGGSGLCCGCEEMSYWKCPKCEHFACLLCRNRSNGIYLCCHCMTTIDKVDDPFANTDDESDTGNEKPEEASDSNDNIILQEASQEDRNSDVIVVESNGVEMMEWNENENDVKKDTVDESENGEKNDEGREDDNNEDYEDREDVFEKKCLLCNEKAKSQIAHLKKNKTCREYYCEKYRTDTWNPISESLSIEDWKCFGRIFKNEVRRKMRQNIEYRRKENNRRKECRNKNQVDSKQLMKEFFDTVENILANQCDICNQHTSNIQLVEEEDIIEVGFDEEEDEAGLENKINICRFCMKLKAGIKANQKLEGQDGTLSNEYNEWAKENVTVDAKIEELERVINRDDEKKCIGLKIYNSEEGRRVLIYSRVNLEVFKLEIEAKATGYPDYEPTVLLPVELLAEDPKEALGQMEAELANKNLKAHFLNLLNVFILDRLNQMKGCRERRMKRNSEVKLGKVFPNNLFPNNLILTDATSLKGCLSEIKGSGDNLSEQRENILFRQAQNGYTNVKLVWKVFTGFDQVKSDPFLATCIVRLNGNIVKSIDKTNQKGLPTKEFKVCCRIDCDPFECKLIVHKTPLEKLQEEKYDLNPVMVTRFMIEKVKVFVDKVKKMAKEYSLFLLFDRPEGDIGDSGFALVGHVWQDCPDVVHELLKEENMMMMLGDGGGSSEVITNLFNWEKTWYSKEGKDVTEITRSNVDLEEIECHRETSLFEAISCCSRQMPIVWSSQGVVVLNTEDPRKAWKMFKRSGGEKTEKVFLNPEDDQFWVEEDSVKKDYNDRPRLTECLVYLQLGLQFRALERDNPNYEKKIEELSLTGGIQLDTEIFVPLITNSLKFPNAPKFLPKLILIRNNKILILKKKTNVVKFKNPKDPMTNLLLCEPWRSSDDFSQFEENPELLKEALKRRKLLMPFSVDNYPETSTSEHRPASTL